MVQPGSADSSATSAGAWCVRPDCGAVVGRAGADEHGADVLVAEVELDLLVGALDEERRVGVHDGPQALERQARRRRRS